jgi:hypothetical protein
LRAPTKHVDGDGDLLRSKARALCGLAKPRRNEALGLAPRADELIVVTLPDEAAKRGVVAYIVDGSPEELQTAIDITLQRFAEYHSLQGAFGRRATIEQAKGILMARHALDADQAFEMLRDHSQHNGHKLVDIAQAIVDSHLLLLPLPQPATPSERPA